MITAVILNRYPEILAPLLTSMRETESVPDETIVVTDRHDNSFPGCVTINSGHSDFVFARNANIGITSAKPESDIVLLNDDCVIVEHDFFNRLSQHAYQQGDIGILSPLIDGGVGNPYQNAGRVSELWGPDWKVLNIGGQEADSMPVCFPCVLIKRQCLDEVGKLDEEFFGYGLDDNDYCIRVRRAGWFTCIVRDLTIRHGNGGVNLERGRNWSLSFAREAPLPANVPHLMEKWAPKNS
jgi:GT2 family glycosyltransferase